MYPRNAASPERIAIGPVILIADGTPQSSGVTVTVRGQGGAEAGSAGTIAYGATGVIVYYTPTQAETDFTSFTLVASKAGCIPACVTVITSASATPGYAGVDWGKVANATSTVGLSGTTIATVTNQLTAAAIATGVWQDTTAGDFTVALSIGKSVMNGVSLGTGLTVNDITTKTGFALTSAYDFAKGTTAMTESYSTDGATVTPVQMMYQIWSFLAETNLTGTTITTKKLDGSTTAMTFTVDSATAPTTVTRAT